VLTGLQQWTPLLWTSYCEMGQTTASHYTDTQTCWVTDGDLADLKTAIERAESARYPTRCKLRGRPDETSRRRNRF
jgi:hypothetical protein